MISALGHIEEVEIYETCLLYVLTLIHKLPTNAAKLLSSKCFWIWALKNADWIPWFQASYPFETKVSSPTQPGIQERSPTSKLPTITGNYEGKELNII